MASKKIIVVVGATGRQGGSVARTFLDLPNWHVRAITRNPSSEAAQALKDKGAEIIQADLTKPSTLGPAFANAHSIFLNTDFWTVFYPLLAKLKAEGKDVAIASQEAYDVETTCGKNAAEAAAAVPTLERIVMSSLPSMVKEGETTRSLHPEAKAWIQRYIERDQPALAKKLSVIYAGAYVTNKLILPALDEKTGKHKLVSGLSKDASMPVIDPTASVGPFVRALIEDEEPGVRLMAYDSDLTIGEMLALWSKVKGEEAEYVYVTTAQLHAMGALWEHLDALDAMKKGARYEDVVPGLIRPDKLKKKVITKSFEEWLRENV